MLDLTNRDRDYWASLKRTHLNALREHYRGKCDLDGGLDEADFRDYCLMNAELKRRESGGFLSDLCREAAASLKHARKAYDG